MNHHLIFLQAVPPAGGDTPAAPVAQTGQPAPGPAGGPPAPSTFGALAPLLFVVPLVLVMWWTSRSQQKKQKELEDKLKQGDHVITSSGLVGKLVEKGDRMIKVEIAPGVKIKMLRSAIVGLDTGDEAPKKD